MSTVPMLASPKLAHHETIHHERVLLDRVLRGEERARSEFVVRYSRLIYHTLYSAGVSRDAIEDLYQMVQVHLWTDGGRRLRLWRADGTLSGYLVTITARFARTHQHTNSCRITVTELPIGWEPADPTPGPEEALLHCELCNALRSLIKELPGRDAELLYRRYVAAQTNSEIATSLNMTVSHVGVALFRAEARLRRRFTAAQAG